MVICTAEVARGKIPVIVKRLFTRAVALATACGADSVVDPVHRTHRMRQPPALDRETDTCKASSTRLTSQSARSKDCSGCGCRGGTRRLPKQLAPQRQSVQSSSNVLAFRELSMHHRQRTAVLARRRGRRLMGL